MPLHRRVGFSVVELIVVIAIIAVLIGLVFVGMRGTRNAAGRTESLNALRQMMAGYTAYSTDHRQTLMPGYVADNFIWQQTTPDGTVNEIDIRVRLADINASGGAQDYLEPEDTASYVWRLAPYLGNAWQTMMGDYRDRALEGALQTEFDAGVYGPADATDPTDLGIASLPAYGLNSIFVGGDTSHGGEEVVDRHPWLHGGTTLDFTRARRQSERLAAVRYTEVVNPARLIVFGPTARADETADPEHAPYAEPRRSMYLGYHELRPPYTLPQTDGDWSAWHNEQWKIGVGGKIDAGANLHYGSGAISAGLPIVRWGTSEYPVANFDGSTTVEDIGALSQNMSRWSPFVTGMELPAISP